MRESIQLSGYLIEQRVEPIIRQSFGYVQTNPIYKDPDTGKSCEIDISSLSASILYKDERSFIKISAEYPPACWRDESSSP